MTAQRVGTFLLFFGVSAWIVYFGVQFVTDIDLPFGLFLTWHLLGVVPGAILRGSKIARWVGEKLRGGSQPAGPEGP